MARVRVIEHNRLNQVTDECNERVAALEGKLLETKDAHSAYERRAESLLATQEKIAEKWRSEHKQAVEYYEKVIKGLELKLGTKK